jgi:hypothetical protein
VIQDVTTQDAAFAVDQEIPASKYPVQENHVEEHDGREARTPIKPDKLAVLVWQRSDTDSLRRIAWQSVTSAPVSSKSGTSEMISPLSGFRRDTWANGAGGSNSVASYVGINPHLEDLLREFAGLLRMAQSRAQDSCTR